MAKDDWLPNRDSATARRKEVPHKQDQRVRDVLRPDTEKYACVNDT